MASSRGVELSNLADDEGVHGGELVEAKPAASLEEEGVGPDGESLREIWTMRAAVPTSWSRARSSS